MKDNTTTKSRTGGIWEVVRSRLIDLTAIKAGNEYIVTLTGGDADANAEYICKAVNSHDHLFQMVRDLKSCIQRLSQDGLTQDERDKEAQWEGEAHELLLKINPDYYQNANAEKI